jgi:hypothetical protein
MIASQIKIEVKCSPKILCCVCVRQRTVSAQYSYKEATIVMNN